MNSKCSLFLLIALLAGAAHENLLAAPIAPITNNASTAKAAVDNGPEVLKQLARTVWLGRQFRGGDLTEDEKARSEAAKQEIEQLNRVLTANPRDAKSLLNRALSHLDVVKIGFIYNEYGQPKNAMTDLDAAIAADPQNVDARALRAHLNFTELEKPLTVTSINERPARSKTAREDLDVVLKKHPNWAIGRVQRAVAICAGLPTGRTLEELARYDQDLFAALADAALAVLLDPEYRPDMQQRIVPHAASRALQLQQTRKEPEKRVALAELAMKIEGETPRWIRFISDSYMEMNPQAALKSIESLLENMVQNKASNESQMRLLLIHGRIAARAGQTSIATGDFENAAKLTPQSLEPVLAYASSLQENKKAADALRVLTEGQGKAANSIDFYTLRGSIAQELGQWKLAAEDYKKAKSIQPENIETRIVLAQAQQQNGNLSEAIATLREASKLSGFNMEHQLIMALFIAASGDEAATREAYRGVALNKPTLERYLIKVKAAQTKTPNAALKALQTLMEANIARQ